MSDTAESRSDTVRWTGTIAVLDEVSVDGRLLHEEALSWETPIPLLGASNLVDQIGIVDQITVDGKIVRAEGTAQRDALFVDDPLAISLNPGSTFRFDEDTQTMTIIEGKVILVSVTERAAFPQCKVETVEA